MLAQLSYVSNRNSVCTDAEIEKILASCKKNNPALEITGVLLYSDSKFVQMVEGDPKILNNLYDKIKLDNRHSTVIMISYGLISERSFPCWHMGARKIAGSIVDFKTDISNEDKIIFNNMLNGIEQGGAKVLGLLKRFF